MRTQAKSNRIILQERFLKDLGNSVANHTETNLWPLIVSINDPIPMTYALYIYDTSHPTGGRPLKEFKINLYVPGQKRYEYSEFDFSEGLPLMVSYVEDYDVYIIYDHTKHKRFKWCNNVQSHLELILDACLNNMAFETKKNGEVQIAVTSKYLLKGIIKRLSI